MLSTQPELEISRIFLFRCMEETKTSVQIPSKTNKGVIDLMSNILSANSGRFSKILK